MYRLNQKGTAGLEFALVLPLLLLLIFGTVRFGVLFHNKQVVTNASREAVRAGITGESDIVVAKIATDYCENRLIGLKNKITSDLLNVTVTKPDAQHLNVAVSFNYAFLFAGFIGIDDTDVSAQTFMRMEPTL